MFQRIGINIDIDDNDGVSESTVLGALRALMGIGLDVGPIFAVAVVVVSSSTTKTVRMIPCNTSLAAVRLSHMTIENWNWTCIGQDEESRVG